MSVWLLVSALAWGGAQGDYEAGVSALRSVDASWDENALPP